LWASSAPGAWASVAAAAAVLSPWTARRCRRMAVGGQWQANGSRGDDHSVPTCAAPRVLARHRLPPLPGSSCAWGWEWVVGRQAPRAGGEKGGAELPTPNKGGLAGRGGGTEHTREGKGGMCLPLPLCSVVVFGVCAGPQDAGTKGGRRGETAHWQASGGGSNGTQRNQSHEHSGLRRTIHTTISAPRHPAAAQPQPKAPMPSYQKESTQPAPSPSRPPPCRVTRNAMQGKIFLHWLTGRKFFCRNILNALNGLRLEKFFAVYAMQGKFVLDSIPAPRHPAAAQPQPKAPMPSSQKERTHPVSSSPAWPPCRVA
jgi:hypothetical protein